MLPPLEEMLAVPGAALNHLPEHVLEMHDANARMCCGALECIGLFYTMDLGCTIPVMQLIERGHNRASLGLFACYEWAWPCMLCALPCVGAPRLRALRRSMGCLGFDDGAWEDPTDEKVRLTSADFRSESEPQQQQQPDASSRGSWWW
jgi:hypothetical protein